MAILKHFGPFAAEGAIVGRLLTGYSNLEVNLLNCVQVANGDFDTALKTMFGKRGETKRIDRALKLVEDRYAALGLGKEFARAIDAMQYCLAIRNQFSHWVWWDDYSGKLAFANAETIAKLKRKVRALAELKPRHIDVALLTDHERYFAYADTCLAWVNYEGRKRAGKLAKNPVKKPRRLKKPRLSLP
jgi:hypothetical protein